MTDKNPYTKAAWDQTTYENFKKILEDIPAPLRPIAEARVSKKAESLINEDNRHEITEKDMITAFFEETPGGFIPPLKNSMDQLNIDYTQYGYER